MPTSPHWRGPGGAPLPRPRRGGQTPRPAGRGSALVSPAVPAPARARRVGRTKYPKSAPRALPGRPARPPVPAGRFA
eukprot:1243669-Pyramimonas_sp.AAC.1